MPFHRDPVIERLERKVRVRCRLDFDHHQPAFIRYRQQVDNISFLTHEARNLRIDMPNVNGREHPADFANEIRLQPSLLVSARQRMATSIAADRIQVLDYPLNRLAQRIRSAFLRYLRHLNTTKTDRYGPSGNVWHGL